jgi:hypothetical protein
MDAEDDAIIDGAMAVAIKALWADAAIQEVLDIGLLVHKLFLFIPFWACRPGAKDQIIKWSKPTLHFSRRRPSTESQQMITSPLKKTS